MISTYLSPRVYDAILPRPFVRTVDWACKHISLPKGSEIKGKFRIDLFPHMAEVLDCCDDPYFERVSVMAASRLGKTAASLALIAKTAACDPHTMAFADADENSTKRVLKRAWETFALCPPLVDQLPPTRLQAKHHMDLQNCEVHGCWSGSPSTAADFGAWLVVKNEVDKMSGRKSSESDFSFLIDERAKGYPDSTIFEISTPSLVDESRIEAAYLAGDRRRRLVPCPHCNHYQLLRTGDGKSPGGLRWKHLKNGRSSPSLAEETAWYECEHCKQKILDEHRYKMLNAGVWLKEGQSIDRRGRITGKPTRAGRHASFATLGTHHSLLPSISWGKIAKKFVEAAHDKTGKQMRHFLNSWEGKTYDPKPPKIETHQLVERLADDVEPRVCPPWACFLTMAADVGRIGEQLVFYWMVCGWGRFKRGSMVDYGVDFGETDFLNRFTKMVYPHADGGEPLRPVRSGIDSGDGPISLLIYNLCQKMINTFPIKGDHTACPDLYRWGFKQAATNPKELKIKKQLGKGDLLLVNHDLTQSWRHNLVHGHISRDDPGWWSLPADIAQDPAQVDLLDQLMADYPDQFRNENGREVCNWLQQGPNECGDIARYNRALAELFTKNGKNWKKLDRQTSGDRRKGRQKTRVNYSRPDDGRDFFVTNR